MCKLNLIIKDGSLLVCHVEIFHYGLLLPPIVLLVLLESP
jgi:hypothetical protein